MYTQVTEGLLDINHPIYKILSSDNAPIWWQNVKGDDSLYIEVRKDNYLNVYFRGGCVAKILYNCKSKQFEVTSHPKYLERFDINNPKWYKKRIKEGKIVYDAIYQDCTDWLSDCEKLKLLEQNIEKIYSGNENGESTSEKCIQGGLIVKYRKKYLDSEFAYRLFDGRRNTIRIDLVKIEDGKIVFEELKRIVDSRLYTTKGAPEILTQMANYEGFLQQNQVILTNYYRTLFQIKEKLGLPVPLINNIDNIIVDPKPTLLIMENYDVPKSKAGQTKRKNRVMNIKHILDQAKITYQLINQI